MDLESLSHWALYHWAGIQGTKIAAGNVDRSQVWATQVVQLGLWEWLVGALVVRRNSIEYPSHVVEPQAGVHMNNFGRAFAQLV